MDGTTVSGTVKWYDAVKGYGFIARDDGGADLFVHRTAVGYEGLNEGDRVEFEVGRGIKGDSAERVRVVERSAVPARRGVDSGGGARVGAGYGRSSDVVTATLPLRSGRVMRYDPEKGYGFIRPDDGGEDVFVHRSAAAPVELTAGDRVEFRLGRGPKGPRAEQVRVVDREARVGGRAEIGSTR